jgi:hypothetical protein
MVLHFDAKDVCVNAFRPSTCELLGWHLPPCVTGVSDACAARHARLLRPPTRLPCSALEFIGSDEEERTRYLAGPSVILELRR